MKKIGLLLFLISLSGCGGGLTWTAWQKNREAERAIRAETPDLAVLALTEALAASPFQPELHFNLGVALTQQKKGEEALKSFELVEEMSPSPELSFLTRFNLGVLATQAQKVDEALAWYQKALEIDPASIEVKTNIELLIKQQQGEGEGEGNSQPNQGEQGQKPQEPQDGEGEQDQNENDQGEGQEDKPKQYQNQNRGYQPREFKGELSEADVKRILGEIKQQEQRIRTEYNRRDAKERPRDKDW